MKYTVAENAKKLKALIRKHLHVQSQQLKH